jgi:hypothetical protein
MRAAIALVFVFLVAVAQASEPMQRLGAGTLRWFGLRVYDAELWTAGPTPDFSSQFALSLRYARALKGTAIAERSVEEIAKLGFGSPAQLAAWGEAMRALFPDVGEGDTLTGVHLPGRGARFYYNGRALGEVADAQFSRAFFSIWLDPRTSAPGLRAALLGER